eukprot:3356735-Rhodomonas_salina.1
MTTWVEWKSGRERRRAQRGHAQTREMEWESAVDDAVRRASEGGCVQDSARPWRANDRGHGMQEREGGTG